MARKQAPKKRATRRKAKADQRPWALWAAGLITAITALRLGLNALDLVPVRFDEAALWAQGHELGWGYFTGPPLVGWLVGLASWLGGPTSFWLRIVSVLSHGVVTALLFVIGRRLWDGRTGFWAAAGYSAAPGVTVSALMMTAAPVMMALWAMALYAWFRAAEDKGRTWWVALGAALGLAIMAAYAAIFLAIAALGYGLFSARGRHWQGTGLAAGVAFLVTLPHLIWLAGTGFAVFDHVAANLAPPAARYDAGALLAFLGAQAVLIGPAWLVAILAALWWRGGWREDWRMRMLAWQTFLPFGLATLTAYWAGAPVALAAPACVAGSLMAARLVLTHDWRRVLSAQMAIGVVAAMAIYGGSFAYATMGPRLPRLADPFGAARGGEPLCAIALGLMAGQGAEVLLSDNDRRLASCMFHGGLGWDAIAVWNPELTPRNQQELISTLHPGDARPMVLATTPEKARRIAAHFDAAHLIEDGTIRTHADQATDYAIWSVQGFEGY